MYGPVDYCKCEFCGGDYHPNENCGCTEDLECQCGTGAWELPYGKDSRDDLRCTQCGSGPEQITKTIVTYPKARRKYVVRTYTSWDSIGSTSIILPGETYKRITQFVRYPDGTGKGRTFVRSLKKKHYGG